MDAPRVALNGLDSDYDWRSVACHVLTSRALDRLEEERLVPERKVLYQFSARGHDMAQVLLGSRLAHGRDATCGYYRSRPLLLSLGVDVADALGSAMGRSGGYSDGRDIGVVFNFPNPGGTPALPMSGGVGAQYTPTAGWAQAIRYHADVLQDRDYHGSIAVVLGGDASVATNGFWAALTIATTQKLPMLFYIEDNGFGISVPSVYQTPGGDIAANLASFSGLEIVSGDGTEPAEAARLVSRAVGHVRGGNGPALLRLKVPRLQGHSFQDTQTYKDEAFVAAEWARDGAAWHKPDKLAHKTFAKHVHLSRGEGLALGLGGVVTSAANVAGLGWIQARMVFFIAAAKERNPAAAMALLERLQA